MMAMRNAARRDSVATLGKQLFWPSRSFVSKLISATGLPVTVDQVFKAVGPQRDGSEFLKVLGAGHVDEIDAAEYEGASIVHDMNVPLPPEHRQRYDLV